MDLCSISHFIQKRAKHHCYHDRVCDTPRHHPVWRSRSRKTHSAVSLGPGKDKHRSQYLSKYNFGIFTARKWSMGQSNVFTFVCHSVHRRIRSLYGVTSCLADWSHVPSRGSLSLVPCSFWGFLLAGSLFRESLSRQVSVLGSLSRGVSLQRGSLF